MSARIFGGAPAQTPGLDHSVGEDPPRRGARHCGSPLSRSGRTHSPPRRLCADRVCILLHDWGVTDGASAFGAAGLT